MRGLYVLNDSLHMMRDEETYNNKIFLFFVFCWLNLNPIIYKYQPDQSISILELRIWRRGKWPIATKLCCVRLIINLFILKCFLDVEEVTPMPVRAVLVSTQIYTQETL